MTVIKNVKGVFEVGRLSPLSRMKKLVSLQKFSFKSENLFTLSHDTLSPEMKNYLKTHQLGQDFENYFSKVGGVVEYFAKIKKMKFSINLKSTASISPPNELPIRIVAQKINNPYANFGLKDFVAKNDSKNNFGSFFQNIIEIAEELEKAN